MMTHVLYSHVNAAQRYHTSEAAEAVFAEPTGVAKEKTSHIDTLLDPFPLPPCEPKRTSAIYVYYGREIRDGRELFNSVQTLLDSNFPGRVRLLIDEMVNRTIRETIRQRFKDLITGHRVELRVLSLPDLEGKELIPHSNKIRALQEGAFVHPPGDAECTVYFDTDTHIHPRAPWDDLLSTLELHDVAVGRDCKVLIEGVPAFLRYWMPNTGVLAMRNTPRTRLVLRDWLDRFRPCNGTHVETCTPGTDQYSFLQLAAEHALRMHKLDTHWNCRITRKEIDRCGITGFPVHSVSVLSNAPVPERAENAAVCTTCGGDDPCHVLHGHWLDYRTD